MKKLILLQLILTNFLLNSFCQDILVLKNGDEIKVKVSEVLPDMVKYKKWGNQAGPIYSEPKGNIFMIKYQNGSKDVFANQEVTNSNNKLSIEKFLGKWKSNTEAGETSHATIKSEGGNIIVLLGTWKEILYQNTGVFKDGKIKVSFQFKGETEISYSEEDGQPYIYIFGKKMGKVITNSNSPTTADKFIGLWYGNEGPITIKKDGDFYILEGYPFGREVLKYSDGVLKSSGMMGDLTYSESSGHIYFFSREFEKAKSNSITQNQSNSNNNPSNKEATTSSLPAFTGLLSLDTSNAIISIVFSSIEDEIGNENKIKNKIVELFKLNKKVKEVTSGGVDTSNIPIRYRIECNTKTFYTSKLSGNQTAYSADLRLSIFLWELDKSGRKINGTPSDNQLIHMKESFLGGGYVSKQGAFEAVLPKIEASFNQILYAYFPVNATITEITDTNKKGEPKKVKISCGINQGVLKNFKFKIIDPSRKSEEYDLEVSELFDNYSICNVKNNESLIQNLFAATGKVGATTIYKLKK